MNFFLKKNQNTEMGKTFLLGVGCQKGGTSWIHNYLESHPQSNMGFQKEYHVFDGLYILDQKKIFRNLHRNPTKNSLRKIEFYNNIDNYYKYFTELVSNETKIKLTGDITPSYSGLPEFVFREIREKLIKKGFKVKVLFLMRDPFERIWSAIRMERRNILKKNPNHIFKIDEVESILNTFDSAGCEFRTKYEDTIKKLENVFSKDEIHYEFYESLFNEESVRKITDFLEIEYMKPNFQEKINESKKSDEIESEAIKTIVTNYYRKTYLFCDEKFNGKVEKYWGNYKYVIK